MMIDKVTEAFRELGVKYAIAGGWAVALHGAVRGTVDLDVVVTLTEANLVNAVKALQSIGLQSRLPLTPKEVIAFRQEYIRNRNLLAWRFTNPTDATEVVDILIVEDLKGLGTTKIKLGARAIPVLALEDLIRMKKAAGRPQDLEDIKALEELAK